MKEKIRDGFELGPQAVNPSVKLSQLYHLLAGEDLKHGDNDIYIEQEIKQITNPLRPKLILVCQKMQKIACIRNNKSLIFKSTTHFSKKLYTVLIYIK